MIEWPQIPVVGIIGSSFEEKSQPDGGGSLSGGSYVDLRDALNAQRRPPFEFSIVSVAEPGTFTFPTESGPIKWRGYQGQLDELIQKTDWPFDQINRLSLLYIGIPNDVLHGSPFSQALVTAYIDTIKSVVDQATVPVIIAGYPPWGELDMQKAAPIYGLEHAITEANYNILRERHRQELEILPSVFYLGLFDDMVSIGDWLHPNTASQDRAAAILWHLIFKILKEQGLF